MDNKTSFMIRIGLSILLLIGVFSETGIYTTTALALILLVIEVVSFYVTRLTLELREATDVLKSTINSANDIKE